MNALWLEDNKISLRDISQPQKPNEALIKIRKAGICSTDLELVKGYYPYTGVIGHEFVGEVDRSRAMPPGSVSVWSGISTWSVANASNA